MAGNLTPRKPSSDVGEAGPGALAPFTADAAFAPAPAVEPPADGVNWGRYIAALKRYKWMILAIILVGTGGGIVATRFLSPEYEVKGTLFVQGNNSETGPVRPDPVLESFSWVELLTTYSILDEVVRRERLYLQFAAPADSAAFRTFGLAKMILPGKYVLAIDESGRHYVLKTDDDRIVEQGNVGGQIGTRVGFDWTPPAGTLGRDRQIKFTVTTLREASNALQKKLKPIMGEHSSFITVSLTGTNPVRLASTMNSTLDEFERQAAELKRKKLTEQVAALDTQLVDMQRKVSEAENALESYRARTITQPGEQSPVGPPGIVSTTPTYLGQYFTDKEQLDAIRRDRQAIEANLQKAKSGALVVDAFAQIPTVQHSPDITATLGELAKLQAELRVAEYKYTDAAPQVKDIQTKIQTIRTQTIPAYAQALAATLRQQENDLAGRIAGKSRELASMPARTIEEQRLTRELATVAGLYGEVAARHQQAKLAFASAQPDVSVVDRAVVPEEPTSNSAPRIILIAFLASTALAIGLAILLDQLDKRFRYPDQVTRELGLSILGAIPAIKKVRPGERDAEEASQVIEAFRTVRMNLAHSYGAAGPVLLTVSSPGAGDGKSLISSNLALSFAEAGYRTLLIDGDIRRGELHRMFATERRPGLLDFLVGQVTLEQILRPTTHKNLTVIPCGTRHQHGPELLGSSAMRDLMATLKTRYNVVIVDSPPLGAGIDPFVLATATGHLMLVLRSGASDRQMAEAKLRLVDRLPVRLLGAVLNDIRTDGVYKYYSYIYGYTADEEGLPQLAAPGEG